MYPEPRLVGPILGSFAAIVCFVIGRYILPEEWQAARVLFILLGGACLLFAIFGWADWLAYRFNAHLKATRQAWYGPQEYYRDLAHEIRLMTRDQLRVFQHIGPLEVSGYLKGTTMYYSLHTSMINIPWSFIVDYLDDCGPIYPDLRPQHGLSDSLRRDYIQAFTREVVANGLAEKPVGNQPAKWLLPYSEILDIFGLGS
jgi:hypothetical protein